MNASKIHELWILHKIIELNIQLAIVAKRLEIEQANPQQRFFSLFLPKIGLEASKTTRIGLFDKSESLGISDLKIYFIMLMLF